MGTSSPSSRLWRGGLGQNRELTAPSGLWVEETRPAAMGKEWKRQRTSPGSRRTRRGGRMFTGATGNLAGVRRPKMKTLTSRKASPGQQLCREDEVENGAVFGWSQIIGVLPDPM